MALVPSRGLRPGRDLNRWTHSTGICLRSDVSWLGFDRAGRGRLPGGCPGQPRGDWTFSNNCALTVRTSRCSRGRGR